MSPKLRRRFAAFRAGRWIKALAFVLALALTAVGAPPAISVALGVAHPVGAPSDSPSVPPPSSAMRTTDGAMSCTGAQCGVRVYDSATNIRTGRALPAAAFLAAEGATADAAKFSDYVFKEGATHGKDAIFRSYGYGPGDSQALAEEFRAQGAAQYRAGNDTVGRLDQYGQRVTIPIRLEGQGAAAGRATTINTGWMVEPNGSIRLLTPFAGFGP